MSDKLSPKDFASITEWAKQYIVGNIKGELLDPVIAVKSNTHTELIYTVNNPNEVDAYFNDELISAKGQSEMTHIWSEDKLKIIGALTAKNYKSSNVVSLEVERAPDVLDVDITLSSTIETSGTLKKGITAYIKYNLTFDSKISISSLTLDTSNAISYYFTSYGTINPDYKVGELSSIPLVQNEIENNSLVLNNAYKIGSNSIGVIEIFEWYYYGYNTTAGSSPNWSKDEMYQFLTIPLKGEITYTYNGNEYTKTLNNELKFDISSVRGKRIYDEAKLEEITTTIKL